MTVLQTDILFLFAKLFGVLTILTLSARSKHYRNVTSKKQTQSNCNYKVSLVQNISAKWMVQV